MARFTSSSLFMSTGVSVEILKKSIQNFWYDKCASHHTLTAFYIQHEMDSLVSLQCHVDKENMSSKKKKGIHIKEIKTDVTWSVVEINETPVVSIVCWCKAHKASVAGQKATELPEA